MTIEEAKEMAKNAMESAKKKLVETKSFEPVFHFACRHNDIVIVPVPGEAMNNRHTKARLGRLMKELAKERDAVAVIFLSDAYMGIVKKDKFKEAEAIIREHPEYGVAKMEEMGLVTKRECIMMCVETPIYYAIGRQYYRRKLGGRPVLEEYQEQTSETSGFRGEGNFFGFFAHEKHQESETVQ